MSLGSFSEAQALVDPQLLERVFENLVSQCTRKPQKGVEGRELLAIDSTLWRVVNRMDWAYWRRKSGKHGGPDHAVRLHVHFDLSRGCVSKGQVEKAAECERKSWREMARKGDCYIGDRNHGRDYKTLREMSERGGDFLVRLPVDTKWVECEQEKVSEADRQAGVKWAGTVKLGKEGKGPQVRIIEVLGQEETIILATTLDSDEAAPELVAHIYRRRWEVEMFFRWLKCILNCRHFFAESKNGVTIQIYLALIAAVLLSYYTGQKPNRRQMEAIQFYMLGYASAEETARQIVRYASRAKKAKMPGKGTL